MEADVGRPLEELSEAELVERVEERMPTESSQSALLELSRRNSPRRFEAFRAVLEDPSRDSRIRRTAAVQLGTEQLPENQALLLSQLDAGDAALFAKVTQALGKIGDEQALARLEQIDPPPGGAAAREHEFAQSLLAYRLHLNRHLIAPPPDAELVEVTDARPIEFEPAGAEEVREAVREAAKDIPAIDLAEEGALRLRCPGSELLLVFSAELRQPGGPEMLRTRTALPFVLLKRGTSLERYFLDHYFFTQPDGGDGEVALFGARPGGELTYAGRIQDSADGFRFTLGSLASPYVPAIRVEGMYNTAQGRLELGTAVASSKVAARERAAIGTPARAASPPTVTGRNGS